ncbi:MAG: short-chain dehydrogenase, partial [Gammaproteobacteria bacterium]|nr:short-chain dehydrogenase [Gammaproteobacteria bacterium]
VASVDGMLEPDVVAQACVEAIDQERLLVLPHEEVKEYMRRKATDPDRWIRGMQRLQELYLEQG